MAAETPQTWAERVIPFDDGDPISGREATIIGEDALNGFRALLLGLAQSHGLPADATHEDLMEAFKQGHALTGEIKTYAGPSAPAGWLLCNGVLVSLTAYAALFGVLAHSYAADGDTTDSTASEFRLPDMRGRTPIGAGEGAGLTARTLGAKGGEEKHTLTTDEMPFHRHNTGYAGPAAGGDNGYGLDNIAATFRRWSFESSGIITTKLARVSSSGGGQPHANMQPWAAVNYIIKT